jgi:hypothetical protein
LKVQVVGAVSFHSVARPGWSLPSGCRAVRLSKMLNEMRMSFEDVLKCGSSNLDHGASIGDSVGTGTAPVPAAAWWAARP